MRPTINPIIVHCPQCGAALSVAPTVRISTMQAQTVWFEFNSVSLKHTCEGPE